MEESDGQIVVISMTGTLDVLFLDLDPKRELGDFLADDRVELLFRGGNRFGIKSDQRMGVFLDRFPFALLKMPFGASRNFSILSNIELILPQNETARAHGLRRMTPVV